MSRNSENRQPWGETNPPAVVYGFAPGRGAVRALKLLEHYRGIVQCDGYPALGVTGRPPRRTVAVELDVPRSAPMIGVAGQL